MLPALPQLASGQGIAVTRRQTVAVTDSILYVGNDFIVQNSLSISIPDVYQLQPELDYTADERFGLVQFTPFFRRMFTTGGGAGSDSLRTLLITYRYRPIPLERERYRRALVTVTDSAGSPRTVVRDGPGSLSGSSIFGKDFQKSGSIFRGFTVGNDRDLSLQSGMRLQFSGHITDDVEVLGALTDEQTPIQPEGTTQTLREIDNIFIEFRSPVVTATLGKFYAQNTGGEYTAFNRKLQGVKATVNYGAAGNTQVVGAVSPGRFRTVQFQGREGDQGPYRLTDVNGGRDLVVIAGTERVYADGVPMVRGEYNDYVIDYGTGEIFFQARQLITGSKRITVDFEYADRKYSRSLVSATHTGFLSDSALSFSLSYLREADNQDSPLDVTLTDTDKSLLAQAGGDRGKAVRSGVALIGRGDTARGSYYRTDTLINGQPDSVFVYAPEDPRSVYSITFSVAPDGRGDYRSVAFGQYEYAGKGAGRYLPVVYLPLPQMRQVGALKLSARPFAGTMVSAQAAYSDVSLNRFSADPASSLHDFALTATISARGDTLHVGGAALGSVRLNASARYLGAAFQTQERISDVDFISKWNTGTDPGQSGAGELLAEGTLTYVPVKELELNGSAGLLRRSSFFQSLRQLYSAKLNGGDDLPTVEYVIEHIGSRDTTLGGVQSSWLKGRGTAQYRIGAFTPGVILEHGRRTDVMTRDSIRPASFGFIEAGPELGVSLGFLSARATARFRTDDSVRFDTATGRYRLYRDGLAQTYTLSGTLRDVANLSSAIEFTYRRKSYDSVPGISTSGRLDNATLLARWQARWAVLNRGVETETLYDVQTEQTARLQRLFLRVPFGAGQYVWRDLDSNGIQTDEEFYLTNANDGEYVRYTLPTEQLYPVTDLRASVRLRLQPRRFLEDSSPLETILTRIGTETYLRVEEKNQTTRQSDVYLLRLGTFQNDSLTLQGNATIQQDITLFDGNPDYSFRLRYARRTGLTQLYNAAERTGNTEQSLRARWAPTTDIGLQLDLASTHSLLHSTDTASNRTFDLQSLSVTHDFTYRPAEDLELGWVLRLSAGNDDLPKNPRTVQLTTNTVRAVYSIARRGRLRAELERTGVTGDNLGQNIYTLPYQLTDGYTPGVTWAGRLNFDYRFGTNLQLTVSYTGRAQPPANTVIHTGQAEIRAFF